MRAAIKKNTLFILLSEGYNCTQLFTENLLYAQYRARLFRALKEHYVN